MIDFAVALVGSTNRTVKLGEGISKRLAGRKSRMEAQIRAWEGNGNFEWDW